MSDSYNVSFAQKETDAAERFKKFENKDPYPEIPPALLNSADISDYVRVTGMIWPFEHEPDKGKLKSASYEIDFLGVLHFFDPETGTYEVKKIEKGTNYTLPMNSISFLFSETIFRLPNYIAARFNLRIKLVHAGFLVGTGPLIDPGFVGSLLIPLHNLTSEKFEIKGGDSLFCVEFTKLSPIIMRTEHRKGVYIPFPRDKRNCDATNYFWKASSKSKGLPASSSIPKIITKAQKDAEAAKDSANHAHTSANDAKEEARIISERFRNLGIWGLAAIFLSFGAVIFNVLNLISGTTRELRDKTEAVSLSNKVLEGKIVQQDILLKKVEFLEAELQKLKETSNTKPKEKKIPEEKPTNESLNGRKNIW